ncbi:LamG-like jellyroll fold domain-containing protein [Caballeronia sp. KNU42]
MNASAAPKTGDVYLALGGRDQYVEIPGSIAYSISTTGELTVAAWLRPDTLNFPAVEDGTDYINWLGKGDLSGASGNQEWTLRMYNHDDPLDSPSRPNRISFYVFNAQGGLGVGSYVQVPIHRGRWMQVVGVADDSRTFFYQDGQYVRCDTYRGPAQGSCEIHYQAPPNENVQLVIEPEAGSAPLRLGTKDLSGFLEGGLTRVRLWNRALNATEISNLYLSDLAPADGLVAEFMLNADTGATAVDTALGNDGIVVNATWATQR